MILQKTIRGLIYLFIALMLGTTLTTACTSNKHMSVEKRKKKQAKNKKRNPHGCPQLDCD